MPNGCAIDVVNCLSANVGPMTVDTNANSGSLADLSAEGALESPHSKGRCWSFWRHSLRRDSRWRQPSSAISTAYSHWDLRVPGSERNPTPPLACSFGKIFVMTPIAEI